MQNFLQGCRGDPIKALRDIDAWVEENRDSVGTETARTSDASGIVVSRPTSVDAAQSPLEDDSEDSDSESPKPRRPQSMD